MRPACLPCPNACCWWFRLSVMCFRRPRQESERRDAAVGWTIGECRFMWRVLLLLSLDVGGYLNRIAKWYDTSTFFAPRRRSSWLLDQARFGCGAVHKRCITGGWRHCYSLPKSGTAGLWLCWRQSSTRAVWFVFRITCQEKAAGRFPACILCLSIVCFFRVAVE